MFWFLMLLLLGLDSVLSDKALEFPTGEVLSLDGSNFESTVFQSGEKFKVWFMVIWIYLLTNWILSTVLRGLCYCHLSLFVQVTMAW